MLRCVRGASSDDGCVDTSLSSIVLLLYLTSLPSIVLLLYLTSLCEHAAHAMTTITTTTPPLLKRRARHLLALLRLPLEGPVGCKGTSAAEAGLVMMMVAGPRSMVMMLMVMLMVTMVMMLMMTMVMMIVMKVHGDGSDGDKLDGNDDCDDSPW